MLYCFVTVFTLFMNYMYPDNDGLFQQENALSSGSKLPWIGLRSILKTFKEWCRHHIHLIKAISNICEMSWRSLLARKILNLQLSERLHGSISLQRSSDHLPLYRVFVCSKLEKFLYNTWHIADDFWHVCVKYFWGYWIIPFTFLVVFSWLKLIPVYALIY